MRTLLVATTTVGLLAVGAPAHAASSTVTGQVSAGKVTWYTTARTITTAGSGIYLRVTSSPVDLKIWWYRCGDRKVSGSPVIFPAGDHSRKRIGSNFRAGTRFCLGASGDIGEGTRTWRGIVDWNVHS
jgi:hypothetical protein